MENYFIKKEHTGRAGATDELSSARKRRRKKILNGRLVQISVLCHYELQIDDSTPKTNRICGYIHVLWSHVSPVKPEGHKQTYEDDVTSEP